MLRVGLLTVFLVLLVPQVAFAQSQEGHVYVVNWYNAHTGQENEYSQGYRDWLRPVFDEMVDQGVIVSYLDLVKNVGTDDATHMLVIEYASWADLDDIEAQDEASMKVLGYPYGEVVDRFNQMRDPALSEIYIGLPSAN
jgi:hypothetical protein